MSEPKAPVAPPKLQHPARPLISYPLQALSYAAFVAFVGYFSTSPAYVHLPEGTALVKLSVQHTGQRKQACRERSAEELAKLAPNMRAASVCPRERAPVAVQVDMDGNPLFTVVAPPGGLANDLPANIYRRATVPAGEHVFATRLTDTVDGSGAVTGAHRLELGAGGVLVIDFDAAAGRFVFRG